MFSIKSVRIPESLVKVGKIFSEHGFKSYLVGGAIRDMFMGKESHDYDIATDATPNDVKKIFKKVIPTGIAHGTVTIRIFGLSLETTTFRTETSYSDGRHPDKVSFASTIEEDLSRRDFTMNAIAADLLQGAIVDPFGGQEDIEHKIIRTVGNPLERFSEDGLRPVRAIRFAGQLGFKIENETLSSISNPEILNKVKGVSVERFRDEFCKMLQTEKPSISLSLLEQTGILSLFIPQFLSCRGCLQKDDRGFHEFDVADHLFFTCDGSSKENLDVILASFYHDIGKPESKTEETKDGIHQIHFHGHENISEKKTIASMTSLKFSNEEIRRVSLLVRHHMFHYESEWSDSAVRRFIIKVGKENIENLFKLRFADIYGMHKIAIEKESPSYLLLEEFRERINHILEEETALSLKDLKVNGHDLMEIGIPRGKLLGEILSSLFETVTDSPELNKKEPLIALAKKIYSEKFET